MIDNLTKTADERAEELARKVLAECRAQHPGIEYRLDVERVSVAARWQGEWHRVAGKTILSGAWCAMRHELLFNGERLPFTPDMSL